ncbi:uncharacterized protein LOC142587587 [Dermacentor variabilis]|uniref:uncharacterized protein LOC142587587 n=1 Tax=Dermacentor variabilis TaxID=34621 RepID=UPI003F5B63CC
MTMHIHLNTLLCALLTIYQQCQCRIPPTTIPLPETLDITKLYCNRSLVWTVNTTAQTQSSCRVDVVMAANATYVTFNRTYYWQNNKTVNPLEGKLVRLNMFGDERGKLDGMLLHGPGAMISYREQLRYLDETKTCGVFSVQLQSGRPWYELRGLNSTVESIPQKCLNLINKVVLRGQKWKSLYNSTCQNIIKNKEH